MKKVYQNGLIWRPDHTGKVNLAIKSQSLTGKKNKFKSFRKEVYPMAAVYFGGNPHLTGSYAAVRVNDAKECKKENIPARTAKKKKIR